MVGYQSRGSVGRALAEGAKEVRIAGQKVKVQAKTHVFSGLSGHAGQSDLLNWFGSIASSRPRVILTHGEDEQREREAMVKENGEHLGPLGAKIVADTFVRLLRRDGQSILNVPFAPSLPRAAPSGWRSPCQCSSAR